MDTIENFTADTFTAPARPGGRSIPILTVLKDGEPVAAKTLSL